MRALAIAVAGGSLVACRSAPSAPRAAVAWDAPVELAVGGGERGPWQQNESRFDHVDDAAVVLAPDGSAVVAWVDHRQKDVIVQRLDAAGAPRGTPVNVSRTPAVFSWLPRVRLSTDGADVYVLWQEIVFAPGGSHGGDMWFARSVDGGATFTAPLDLTRSVAGDGKGRVDPKTWDNGSFDLAIGTDGTLYATWTEYEGRLWFARSTDRGATFAAPVLVAEDTERPARAPALATAGDAVYLAWTTGEDASADIRVAVARGGGAFGAPVIVAATAGYSDAPALAVDARGRLHLAFCESAGGPFDRYDVRYTRSDDGGRRFEPPRVVGERGAYPALALGAGEVVHLLWEHYPDHAKPPRGLAHAVSTNGGAAFTPATLVPGSADPAGGGNGSFQGRMMRKLAVSGGAIAVVNASLALGRSSRVWVIRGRVR